MPWQLTCIAGDAVPHRVVLDGALDIGRDPHCDIRLLDDRSSRFHARITGDQRGAVVEDLNSSNGTFVGDQRLSDPARLADGDLVRCGAVTFVVSDLASAASATRVVTDAGAALDIAAQRQSGSAPASAATERAAHQCLRAVGEAAPGQRGTALATAAAKLLHCPQAAVVLGGRVQGQGMSARLARRLAGGDHARLLTLGCELVGQTVAAEAVGSAATAPLGRHGHLLVARGLDHDPLSENDLDLLAAIAADTAGHFSAGSSDDPALNDLVGSSLVMQQLRTRISRIALADATVLITGESGTGKELVARAIHGCSGRSAGPMIAVNCAAVADNLFEAELFGHVKGAFTGADSDRAGRFAEADGGTLFLDEVGELPERLQAKLLRVLQEGMIETVGGTPRQVDVRVLAATNRDLQQEVAAGRFREDLFYRLDVIRVHTPPLRDHLEDIPQLASHLLTVAAHETGISQAQLSNDALTHLQQQSWPGNVRQLSNILTRGLVLGGDTIAVEHLELSAATNAPGPAADADKPFPTLAEMEAAHVRAALLRTEGNRSAAARLLGISRPTLLKKITDYGVQF